MKNEVAEFLARCIECQQVKVEHEHQTSMVEVHGMIQNFFVSILIDPGASLSYISPSIA